MSATVAFVISEGANLLDLAGPWEVFRDVVLPGHPPVRPYRLTTVSDTTAPVTSSGGLTMAAEFTLERAPQPTIICVGAQAGSAGIHAWIRRAAEQAEVVMSVCTGAFQLGRAGLLDGRRATTHHHFWDEFAREFPEASLVRNARFVSAGKIFTAGGLTSGIDLALHVVAMRHGAGVAAETAAYLEHQSDEWAVPWVS